jgi:uncharacterized coiled-coil protein SlyX
LRAEGKSFQPPPGTSGLVVEVTIDLADGSLGWDIPPNSGVVMPSVPPRAPVQRSVRQPRGRSQQPAERPSAQRQAMLDDRVEKLEATVAQQQKVIEVLQSAAIRASVAAGTVAQQQKGMEVLTAQLKEQAAQIQKLSAQLEVSKSPPQVVANKP